MSTLREFRYLIYFFCCLVLFFSLIALFISDSSNTIFIVSSIATVSGLLTIVFASELNSIGLDYAKALRRFITDLMKVDEEELPLWMFSYFGRTFTIWSERVLGTAIIGIAAYGFYKGITI